jgi:hypothetical protein
MSDTTNHFSGTVYFKDSETGEEREVKMIVPDLQDPIVLAAQRPCVARAGITLGDGSFSNSYKLYLGGEVSCSESTFWSGETHNKIVDHLVELSKPLVRDIEEKWFSSESKSRTEEKFPDLGGKK